MTKRTKQCPHDEAQFCPLYHAAHDPDLCRHGCDDGQLDTGSCGTSRGVDYDKELAALRAKAPRLVGEVEFHEAKAKARKQRERNMRAIGLH